jgi:hypothetical protein
MATLSVSITIDSNLGFKHSEVAVILQALEAIGDDLGRGQGTKTSGDAATDIGVPHCSAASWTYTPSASNP